MRIDKRNNDEIRQITIIKDYTKYAEGSVLINFGDTKVICNATVEDKVPAFKKGSGEGWVTAEYSMLPRATMSRNQRDVSKLKLNGRSSEIQRLIGRSLRSVVDLTKMGERTITVDCDVIQADGGTRTASITGGFVAMVLAFLKLKESGLIENVPVNSFVSAISVGIVNDEALLDLCYAEDSRARVDMNLIMTDKGEFIELQGTGEQAPFTKNELAALLKIGEKGITELIELQREVLSNWSL